MFPKKKGAKELVKPWRKIYSFCTSDSHIVLPDSSSDMVKQTFIGPLQMLRSCLPLYRVVLEWKLDGIYVDPADFISHIPSQCLHKQVLHQREDSLTGV